MKKFSFFYGFWIIVSCAGIQAIGVGTYVSFGVFFKPLVAEFDWSRATLSGAHSLAFLISGLFGILVGRLCDRFGPRALMTGAGIFFGTSILLLSTINAPWQLYLFYSFLFGIGLSAVDVIPLNTTARWFVRQRGIMTGMVKMGTGFGQMVMPFIASLFIENFGWRRAYSIIGGMGMVLIVLIAQILRSDPAQMGLPPDAIQTETTILRFGAREMTSSDAIRSSQFWIIFFANLSVCFTLLSIMVHIVPHAIDIGLSPTVAASILSIIGGISMVGRFFIGHTIDRIGNRRSMIICFILLIIVLFWLQISKKLWMLYLFAAVYGFAHGGFFTVISPIVAEYFGIRSHGLLFGIVAFSGAVGGFIGPIFTGSIFDLTGNYGIAFWGCLCAGVMGLVLILFLRPFPLKAKEV